MITTTIWKAEHRFESTHLGNTIFTDGDNKEGHGPKALLLSGLAGCTGVDIVDVLAKMRVAFTDLSIEATATLTEEHPKVFTTITLIYKLKTDKANWDKVIKAIELSLEKYCGVAAMLRKNSSINYELELL